jgi:hypothetical protein
MFQEIHEVFLRARIANRWEPAQVHSENQNGYQSQPKGRHRDAGDDKSSGQMVPFGVVVNRCQHARGHGDDDCHYQASNHEVHGGDQAQKNHFQHRRAVGDRGAQVALKQIRQPVEVLDDERLVQSQPHAHRVINFS